MKSGQSDYWTIHCRVFKSWNCTILKHGKKVIALALVDLAFVGNLIDKGIKSI